MGAFYYRECYLNKEEKNTDITCITGLSGSQTIDLINMINDLPQEDAPKEDYSISFEIPIELHRQNSLWHGGPVASISYRGLRFSIEARGEIRAYLNDVETDREIVYIKDGSNNNNFYDQVRQYLKTDLELERAIQDTHGKYKLELIDNNWWEIFVLDKNNECLPESWVADEDEIMSAVVETLKRMDEYIDDLNSRHGVIKIVPNGIWEIIRSYIPMEGNIVLMPQNFWDTLTYAERGQLDAASITYNDCCEPDVSIEVVMNKSHPFCVHAELESEDGE